MQSLGGNFTQQINNNAFNWLLSEQRDEMGAKWPFAGMKTETCLFL